MWLALIGCDLEAPEPDDTDAPVVIDDEWTPPAVQERSAVRVMNHIWDRYGSADLGRGLDLSIPPENPAALVEAFPTGGNTGYADLLLPGTYTLAATDEDGDVVRTVSGLAVSPGLVATVELYGLAAVPATLGHAVLLDDRSAPPDGDLRIRLFNGAVGTGMLDVMDGTVVVADDLVYGTASAYTWLPLGDLTLDVDVATPQPPQPLDGIADARCTGTIDEDSFVPGRARVVHGTFAPAAGSRPGVGAILAYVDGDYPDDPLAQEPILLPCVPLP